MSSLPGDGTDVSKIQHVEPVVPTHSSDKAKLAGDLIPSRAGLMADLVLMGKPDAQQPENLHTHTQDLEWKMIQVAVPVPLAILPVVPDPQGKLQAGGRVWV